MQCAKCGVYVCVCVCACMCVRVRMGVRVCETSSSCNWILMSCQPHRVTSGQSNSGHKQRNISKLFSHIYISTLCQVNLQNQSLHKHKKSIYKTNHFTGIKHTYTNMRNNFLREILNVLLVTASRQSRIKQGCEGV